MNEIRIVSPVDGEVLATRQIATEAQILAAVQQAERAFAGWSVLPLAQRAEVCERAIDYLLSQQEAIGVELTRQMGRPLRYTPGEIKGLAERGRHMIQIAESALADISVAEKEGYRRFIRRAPLGVVATIAPWNYPYLTAVNSIIPALMAGNAVLLKHSAQTLLCGERFAEAFAAAGIPEGVFQNLVLGHEGTELLIQQPQVKLVSFTGSVQGGRAIEQALAGHFKGLALELGGKDPAYVRADADLGFAIENIIDGAYFNSGQSCCGIERVYVDAALYDAFVEGAAAQVLQYCLGSPLETETTLGPMVNAAAADHVRLQVTQALQAGARALIEPQAFPLDQPASPYLAPQLLVDVDHSMAVMKEESFGPVLGIMRVNGDAQAIDLMNDSPYGLTASIWTRDSAAAETIGCQLQTGTVFMNRCDYLDPALAWVGVKASGRGCALSSLGYHQLTRPQSFHLREDI